MIQQIKTFDSLFSHVKPGGIFLCEDTHTSYFPGYGGELKNPGTSYQDSMVFFEKSHTQGIRKLIPLIFEKSQILLSGEPSVSIG